MINKLTTMIKEQSIAKNKSITIVSTQFDTETLFEMLIADFGQVDYDKIVNGTINDEEWDKIVAAAETLGSLNIYFTNAYNKNHAESDFVVKFEGDEVITLSHKGLTS